MRGLGSRNRGPGGNRAGRGGSRGGPHSSAGVHRHSQLGKSTTSDRVASRSSDRDVHSSAQLRITGWHASKHNISADSAAAQARSFLERRATQKKKAPVRIRKYRIEGENLFITVAREDVKSMLSLHEVSLAGQPLRIELHSTSGAGSTGSSRGGASFSFQRKGHDSIVPDDSQSPEQVSEKLKAMLASRYNTDTKYLDLSDLSQHPDIKSLGFKTTPFNTLKFMPALLKIVNSVFQTADARAAAVHSISLAHNGLHKVVPAIGIADAFPELKNLDMSGNLFKNMDAFLAWQFKFPQLEHIIVTGTPLVESVKDYRAQLICFFPALRIIDQQAITPEEKLAAVSASPKLGLKTRLPLWEDADGIGEGFVRMFFGRFDQDRKALAAEFYGPCSRVSFAIETSGLRDPSDTTERKTAAWRNIAQSRNLLKITHNNARLKREHYGSIDIAEFFATLPGTQHPNFDPDQLHRWLLECHPIHKLPDITGSLPGGVNGLKVSVHGEYDELEAGRKPSSTKRSFDRVFVLGPGGSSGILVYNDMTVVRAYGGTAAFVPEETADNNNEDGNSTNNIAALLSTEQQAMVLELQRQSGMNQQYSAMCLEQTGWMFESALASFNENRAAIPPEAFVLP